MKQVSSLFLFITLFTSCRFIERAGVPVQNFSELTASPVQVERFLLINGLSLDWQIFQNNHLSSPGRLPYASSPCLSPNAIKAYGSYFYLVCSLSQEIFILDQKDFSLLKIIQLPSLSNPWDIEIVNDQLAFVTAFQRNSLLAINPSPENVPNRIIKEIPLLSGAAFSRPQGMALFQAKLYVALTNLNKNFVGVGLGEVAIIDINQLTVEKFITTSAPNTTQVRLGPDALLYAISTGNYDLELGGYVGDGTIDQIDPHTEKTLHTMHFSGAPLDIQFHPSNNLAFVTNGQKGELFSFDYQQFSSLKSLNLTPSPCGVETPEQMSFLSSIQVTSHSIFVTEFNSNCLIEVDSLGNQVLGVTRTGSGPSILLMF